MLSTRRLLDHGGVTLTDVTCRLPTGRGHAHEAGHHAIVFVRRGCFVRTADATSALLDPTQAYCMNPGQEQRYDHPHAGGEQQLARLAADLGFADQSHLCRVIRNETGHTPSSLRRALS